MTQDGSTQLAQGENGNGRNRGPMLFVTFLGIAILVVGHRTKPSRAQTQGALRHALFFPPRGAGHGSLSVRALRARLFPRS
jgi:hypothetical protein